MNIEIEEEPKIEQGNSCFHCGDKCGEITILKNDKSFCCQGCERVYELLNDNQLSDYYSCDLNPGISPRGKNFEFLNSIGFEW